jgi:hypothetical protein
MSMLMPEKPPVVTVSSVGGNHLGWFSWEAIWRPSVYSVQTTQEFVLLDRWPNLDAGMTCSLFVCMVERREGVTFTAGLMLNC